MNFSLTAQIIRDVLALLESDAMRNLVMDIETELGHPPSLTPPTPPTPPMPLMPPNIDRGLRQG